MSAGDPSGISGSSGAIDLYFSSLEETVYIDTEEHTMRQVGAIFYPDSAFTFQFEDTQEIVGPLPSPPTQVSATVTVHLAPTLNPLVFDTGPQPLTFETSGGFYSINNAPIFGNGILMNGYYSLITGGQTYSNSFSYSLSILNSSQNQVFTFKHLFLTNSPSSIELSGLGIAIPELGAFFPSPGPVVDFTALNGYHFQLSPGFEPWPGSRHLGEIFGWTLTNTITAANIASGAPIITNQPRSLVVHAHDMASFQVSASGTVPLAYQWTLNGTNLAGATSGTLTVSNVMPTDLGLYAVIVTNNFGTTVSSNAQLEMYPFIAAPFTGAVLYWGQDGQISLNAWGTEPLSYQWFKDGISVSNATSGLLMLTNVQFSDAGRYSAVVTNPFGSVTNLAASLIVQPAGVSLGLYPGVTIKGVVGFHYSIQSTTDLTTTNSWMNVTNIVLTQPTQLWIDTDADTSQPNYIRRYYRVLPGQ